MCHLNRQLYFEIVFFHFRVYEEIMPSFNSKMAFSPSISQVYVSPFVHPVNNIIPK